MTLRALLLDVDDTICDTRHAFGVATGAIIERYLPHLPGHRRQEAVAHWIADRHGWFRRYTRGEMTMAEQRRRRAVDLHEAFGGPVLDEHAFTAWDELYGAAFEAGWRPAPGVHELLDWAAAHDLVVGAVTNADALLQTTKLRRIGLADRVPLLVTMSTFGVGKPDPRVFREACRLLAVEPGRAAYLGDELRVDAEGARDAGLTGVWLRHGRPDEAPHDVLVADALAAVPALLAPLIAAGD